MAGRHALPVEDRRTRRADTSAVRPRPTATVAERVVVVASPLAEHRPAEASRRAEIRRAEAHHAAARLAAVRRVTAARALPVVATAPAVAAPVLRHERRAVSAKRLSLIVAPILAMTSCIAFGLPANADTLSSAAAAVTSSTPGAQQYTVSRDITLPVIEHDGTTIIAAPAPTEVVVSGGATVSGAQSAIVDALSAGGKRAQVIQTALTYLGDTYVEGGATHAGIDCSGLVMVSYASVGIPLVHYVPTQDAAATTIPESEAQPGDLVVYDSEAHIGLYLGNGLVIQAPHPGEPVDIIPMFSAPHHFARVLPAD
ncbi:MULTISPECIES: C40 family peptidase [unclassified Curtobacterium]|uniref:C40 family peptidase n=1 Tax=unclassified Curtobacterium TaxID=257496 RepID=UPI0021ABF614|nr:MULTISPECIES: C40 family peptidase [unclassified Curtobacterium]WIB64577.1 C40 family peptidase [Curtobacterium sp. MCBD17_040]WIE55605.1 C40 family peptidase [Curtobacterium sp. MCBD17_003]